MKKLSKISLHNLSQAELAKKEQKLLKGGCSCTCTCTYGCTCKYAGDKENDNDSFYGGSSTTDNGSANAHKLVSSPSAGTDVGAGW